MSTVTMSSNVISQRWRDILLLVPGYDSIATAEDCWFDEECADNAIGFIETMLTHFRGEKGGQPFLLELWQKAIVGNLFGWKRPDGKRRYREAFIYVSRKNGKSALAAAIILTLAFLDEEAGAELYSAASNSEQAEAVFSQAEAMVDQEPELAEQCQIYRGGLRKIVCHGHWEYKAISSDAGKNHGKNVHAAIIDELHEQPNRDLVDAFQTSTAARKQSLIIYTTTADYNRVSICNEKYDYACSIRDGIKRNTKFFPVIYEADMNDDWTDPKVWAKANPNLGVSVELEYLEGECKKAQEIPAYENTFRRLHLCQRTQQDVRAIPMDQWTRCGYGADPLPWRERLRIAMRGKRCLGGLDLASTSDLTALALLFGDYDEGYDVLPFFWCPGDTAEKRSRRDGVDYVQWGRAGYICLTEGNETDYRRVRREIALLAQEFDIHHVAADRLFQGGQLCQDLIYDGMNVSKYGQRYVDMAAPTQMFLGLVAGGRLRHGNNPVLHWMASNAATEGQGGPGEDVLKFSKHKSTERIDGIVAIAMALGIAPTGGRASVYEHRGFIEIG